MNLQVLTDLVGLDGLTKSQREIIEHALGPERGAYRNHFVTGPGSTDYDDCLELVRRGFMTHAQGNAITGGDDLFRVTDFARKALLLEGIEETLAVLAIARRIRLFMAEGREAFRDEEDWILVHKGLLEELTKALERFDEVRKSKSS